MKEYKNYSVQVNKNVSNLNIIDIDENSSLEFYDKLYELKRELITEQKELELSIESGFELYSDDLTNYIYEDTWQEMESIYVTYKVDLIGAYNHEHERLEIVCIDEIDSYVMPVYAYGMAWTMLGVLN